MNQQTLHRKATGLYTQFNPVALAPEGSLQEAENVVIEREGVTSLRRGFERTGTVYTNVPSAVGEFKDSFIALDGTTLKYATGASSWSGTFNPPDASTRMRFFEERENLYFTSDVGLWKNDALANDPVKAGMPQGLDIELAEIGTGGWFGNNQQVGYRVVFGREDANGYLILGAPSLREIDANDSGSAVDIDVTFTIPDGVVAGDFYELYRTEISASSSTDPGDEHYKIIRNEITSGDITAGTITFSDTYSEDFLGEKLYTNPTEQTISQANDRPPFCHDFAMWKGYPWFANTRREHQIEIQLLTTTGLSGDTLTITTTSGADVYTAGASEVIGSDQYEVVTGGTAAENIRDTCKSLVRVINRTSTNTEYYAHYVSGINDAPGRVLIRYRTLDDDSFTVDASDGTLWTPDLDTTRTSSKNEKINSLHRGKFEQPEACPRLVGETPIGSEKYAIKRIIPLNESLIILKEDGIWRVSGEGERSFTFKLVDTTTRINAPETAVTLKNSVFCVSDQGVVQITESGTAIVSRPIETDFKKLYSISDFATSTHAVAYESERKYIVFTKDDEADTTVKRAWVYDHITHAWTQWVKEVEAAHVMFSEDKLYMIHAVDKFALRGRKNFNTSLDDFMDEEISITVDSVGTTTDASGETVTELDLTYSYTGKELSKGFLFRQGSEEGSIITVTDNGSNSYTVSLDEELSGVSTGAASVFLPIAARVRWSPEYMESSNLMKQCSTIQIYFESNDALHNEVGVLTDIDPGENLLTIERTPTSGWGVSEWGTSAWGDESVEGSTPLRFFLPRNKQLARTFSLLYEHEFARERFDVLGVAYTYRKIGERTVRTPA